MRNQKTPNARYNAPSCHHLVDILIPFMVCRLPAQYAASIAPLSATRGAVYTQGPVQVVAFRCETFALPLEHGFEVRVLFYLLFESLPCTAAVQKTCFALGFQTAL